MVLQHLQLDVRQVREAFLVLGFPTFWTQRPKDLELYEMFMQEGFPMDFLSATNPNISIFEIALLLLSTALANMFGKAKIALLITCFFALFWGFFLNYDIMFVSYRNLEYSYLFFGFPFIILMLTLIGLLRQD